MSRPAKFAKAPQVAVVGGESLAGNDLREVLADSILGGNVKLIGSEDPGTAILTEEGGEPVVITGLDADNLNGSQVVFFAGTPVATWKAYDLIVGERRPVLVDLSGGLEERPEARLRAPAAEPEGYEWPDSPLYIVAHPAASILASFLGRLQRFALVQRSVAQIFEPASERGRRGVEELQRQTVSLLSFQPVAKEVFDAQLSFNMLAAYGTEAAEALEGIEQRIDRHLASLLHLHGAIPMPSLRLVQAPVMHGYSISLWVELDRLVVQDEVEAALSGPAVDVRSRDLEAPNVVDFAGQSGIAAGQIRPDRNNPRGWWFWLVADNFRIFADDAVAIARGALLRSRPA
jgi:aspartate-semialdehyde dehydrogenase